LENRVNFHFHKSIWDFEPSIKSYGKISERGWKGICFWHLQTSSLKFFHNFWLESLNLKWILGDETSLDLITLFSSKIFEKKILLCLKAVGNSNFNINPSFWQWAVMLSTSHYPIVFEDSWWKLNFLIKMMSPLFILTIVNEAFSSFFH